MKFFWQALYNLVLLPLLYLGSLAYSLFNRKVRQGLKGRRRSISVLKEFFRRKDPERLVYWFHAASHGEYEQVRPVLAGLKEVEPEAIAVVSFFSPSGYEHARDPNIDCKIYLPTDFYWNCWRSLKVVRPHKLIFAEYDLWPNFVWCARRLGIKTTLFSARIHKGSSKVWPILKSLYRQVYRHLDSLYTVSEKDYIAVRKLLGRGNRSLVRVLGNPRYDRVQELAKKSLAGQNASVFEREKRLIAGSVWPQDEEVILPSILDLMSEMDELYLTWVPHEPTSKFLSQTLKSFESTGMPVKLFSQCTDGDFRTHRAIIVDQVGVLAELYWDGQIAYVGGGFSSGIHNVMEPAIARLPILFGPRFHNSGAAEELIKLGGGFCVTSHQQFRSTVEKLLKDREFYLKSSMAATEVIHRNIGSAVRVVRGILRD
ncbi:MAG: 3-deoxy-D-manno-octulosonic acid transferase [Fidelibacterota bacterium]